MICDTDWAREWKCKDEPQIFFADTDEYTYTPRRKQMNTQFSLLTSQSNTCHPTRNTEGKPWLVDTTSIS